jgi:CBS domain containing-hemolysin-like protein
MIYACEAVLPLARYVIMHPTGPVRRTNLYNMVLILLSIIFAAIAIAISQVRHRIWFEGDLSSTGERSEQSRVTSPVKPFLVVVLPDGTIVTSTVAGQV